MPVSTVLFDLDGTLLPMDNDAFVKAYFSLLTAEMAPHGYAPQEVLRGMGAGLDAMVHNDGARTNEEVFWDSFAAALGERVRKEQQLFESFYAGSFQQARAACDFTPLAKKVVSRVQEKGLRPVLATNPVFPAVATESRIRWAGLSPADFCLYTTYENSCRCKPNPAYYTEILDKIGCAPEECLMVGNDATEDMVAAQMGMQVFLLTDCLLNRTGADISAYPQGDFAALLRYIDAI